MVFSIFPVDIQALENNHSHEFRQLSYEDSSYTNVEMKVIPDDCHAEDQFGRAVDVFENYAIVGAYGNDDQATDSGAAYMLYYENLEWCPIQKLIAPDGEAFDYFGVSVSIDQDMAIVGAYGDNDQGNKSGSAYVYQKNSNVWNEYTKIKSHDGKSMDYFGCSVDISGPFIIVGAYGVDDYGNNSGAAYIFEKDDHGVHEQQKLVSGDANAFDYFGYSVSISGNYAIIGAYGVQYSGEQSGAAYIFERHGERWLQLIKLVSSDAAQNDYFGRSVSISGQYALVGAIGKDASGKDSGAAYFFERSGFYWSRNAKIVPQHISANNCFGASVNISNNYAIIGAHSDDLYGMRTGAAYVYQLNNNHWALIEMIRPTDGSDGDFFGYSVAISGNKVIAGAYGNDAKGEKSGAAYIYDLISP